MLRRIAVRFFATLGLLITVVTATPIVPWYAAALGGHWDNTSGDVLVVLSASGPNAGIMDPSTYWRCFMALLFYREHPFRRIIVSGREAAPAMRDFMVFN